MAKGGAPGSGLADGSDAAANLYENNLPHKASDTGVDDAEHSSTTTEASEELEVELQGAPASSANYTAEHPEVIVVGAGTAGASLAIALARQGRKVLLLEKSMAQQDRIVGELLQPGGVRALQKLGLDECATEGCDSVRVDGYTIILPPGVSSQKPDGAETVLYYPEQDPEGALEQFGAGVRAAKHVAAGSGAPRGRSFHNCRFVQRLRETALAEPNVSVVEGVVTQLVEEGERVVGVRYKLTEAAAAAADDSAAASDLTADREVIEVRAPLTVVADGIWSGLRKCANTNKPVYISSFVGVLVTHPPMEAPVPHRNCGHVVLAQPSPILIYQISATETRVLVDVAGKMPSASTGALNDFLVQQAQYLPAIFKQPFLDAVARGGVKSMPNRALASSSQLKPGAVLIGDALNMRHPLTGGGMTVALKDVALFTKLLVNIDCASFSEVETAVRIFHKKRAGHAATINVLANALYAVFTTPVAAANDGTVTASAVTARSHLQDSCFEYLSLGGAYAAGPVGLLSGLTPSPGVLAMHFFMVALHGVQKHLFPLGFLNPMNWLIVYRLLLVACGIIMPLLEVERSTCLSWLPVRKLVQLLFPWEHMRWET